MILDANMPAFASEIRRHAIAVQSPYRASLLYPVGEVRESGIGIPVIKGFELPRL
jgi:hypothetical protein